jgi:hypothetical protein
MSFSRDAVSDCATMQLQTRMNISTWQADASLRHGKVTTRDDT